MYLSHSKEQHICKLKINTSVVLHVHACTEEIKHPFKALIIAELVAVSQAFLLSKVMLYTPHQSLLIGQNKIIKFIILFWPIRIFNILLHSYPNQSGDTGVCH